MGMAAFHLFVDVGALKDGLEVEPVSLHGQPRFKNLRHLGTNEDTYISKEN